MTVCVCLANKGGLALAADSTGSVASNGKVSMYYETDRKLFQMSKTQPIGALTSGNAFVHGVSVEQILQEFSCYLDTIKPLTRLDEIGATFEDFLIKRISYFHFDDNFLAEVSDWINSSICIMSDNINGRILNTNNVVVEDVFKEELHDFNTFVEQLEEKFEIDEDIDVPIASFKQQYEDTINDWIKGRITAAPVPEWFIESFIDAIVHACLYQFLKNHQTTFFFAGYGIQDSMPKQVKIDFYGLFGEVFLAKRYPVFDISKQETPCNLEIVAQSSTINNFLIGLNRLVTDKCMHNLYIQSGDRLLNPANTKLNKAQCEDLNNRLYNHFMEWRETLINKAYEMQYTPFQASLNLLSIVDLGELAEGLVDMTSFSRKYIINDDSSTVGGPTDVALISKVGGFIWIKNKMDVLNKKGEN